jgi:hypothetical protein
MRIDEIDLSKCLPNKDFGQGFYVTKLKEQAKFWATRMGNKYHTSGVITEFLFYDSPFTERLCNVKHFNGYDEEWLDFIIYNRSPLSQPHNYDIVEGAVADDDVANRIVDYLAGKISKSFFLEELKYHKPTHQICFCTVKSLLTLEKIDKEKCITVKNISTPIIKMLMIDNKVDENAASDILFSSTAFQKLSSGDNFIGNKNWQEIYEMLKSELSQKN